MRRVLENRLEQDPFSAHMRCDVVDKSDTIIALRAPYSPNVDNRVYIITHGPVIGQAAWQLTMKKICMNVILAYDYRINFSLFSF